MNLAELIEKLQEIPDPDQTLVVATESEIDEPCEFVALDEFIREVSSPRVSRSHEGVESAAESASSEHELSDFTAEAFFAIEAPNEQAARRTLEAAVDAVDEMLRSRAPDPLGCDIQLCMEVEHDRYAVEEA